MTTLPLFDVSGRKAIVTGASRGIGQAIAKTLAEAGVSVAITARDTASLTETLDIIRTSGGNATAFALDVTDVAACRSVIAEAARSLGRLDILVNNAGYEEIHPSLDVEEALWDKIISTNLKGSFFCAQAAARAMQASGAPGSIINLCSLTSYVGVPTATPYGSSKSGLLGMTHALAAEWAPLSIRVNALAPGYFRTAMTDIFYENEDWQEKMLDKIPMRRFGAMGDLSGALIFLASDASAYVSGHCIPVDGGYLASI